MILKHVRAGDDQIAELAGGLLDCAGLAEQAAPRAVIDILRPVRVTDGDAQLDVSYDKILPDLFREGQAVVATGRMAGGVFVAEEVLAKHDETYMPKELADKMGQAHTKHQVPATPPATGTP